MYPSHRRLRYGAKRPARLLGHDGAPELEVGDRLICGILHPCTAFDKWRKVPMVDDTTGSSRSSKHSSRRRAAIKAHKQYASTER